MAIALGKIMWHNGFARLQVKWFMRQENDIRVLIIADPQLTDRTSYNFAKSGPGFPRLSPQEELEHSDIYPAFTVLWFIQLISDSYMRKSFSALLRIRFVPTKILLPKSKCFIYVVNLVRPNFIVFLGDLMDGGRKFGSLTRISAT